MSSLSGLEIGLCFLFGCILFVLSAELYYLLWWKKRFSKNHRREDIENLHFSSSNNTLPTYTSCWKTSKSPKTQDKDLQTHVKKRDSDMGSGSGQNLVSKGLGDESLDLELMRLHNLCGPPRFLFTINEETKEDLESERSKKGSRTRSLSDVLDTTTLDTPFLSPIASPPLKPNLEAYNHHGLNPLFDFESNEFTINKMRSSPPPTFKFLRDAEEKFLKRLMQTEEGEKRESFKKMDQDISPRKTEEKDGCFLKLVVNEGGHQTNSRVLPLACSPPSTTMAPIDKKW